MPLRSLFQSARHRLAVWLRDLRLTWWDLRNPDPPDDQDFRLRDYLCTARLGKTESEPVIRGPFHCVNCGHRGTCLIPTGAVSQELENQILDMLQCPICGLYTMCSD